MARVRNPSQIRVRRTSRFHHAAGKEERGWRGSVSAGPGPKGPKAAPQPLWQLLYESVRAPLLRSAGPGPEEARRARKIRRTSVSAARGRRAGLLPASARGRPTKRSGAAHSQQGKPSSPGEREGAALLPARARARARTGRGGGRGGLGTARRPAGPRRVWGFWGER